MIRLSQNVQAFDAEPRSNVLVFSTRTQELFYMDRIRGIPPSDLLVQPYNRRTARPTAFGFTPLNAVTPNGLVGIFRSDHDFKNNGILVRTVNQAIRHVEFYGEYVVVVDKIGLAILDCSKSRRKQ